MLLLYADMLFLLIGLKPTKELYSISISKIYTPRTIAIKTTPEVIHQTIFPAARKDWSLIAFRLTKKL